MHQPQIATNNTKDDSVLLIFGKEQKLLLTSKREYKLIKVSKHHAMHQPQIATNNTKDDSVSIKREYKLRHFLLSLSKVSKDNSMQSYNKLQVK